MIVIPGGGGGDITAVVAGDGLSGGATDGSASLAVDLGTNPGLEFSSNKLQIAKGISQHDVPQFAASVADNDFLRIDGTTVEGLSDSEVLSAIGGQASLTFGISNTNAVKVDSASVADDEYARFTANGLESRSNSEVLSDIGGAALTGSTDNTVATVTGANALAGEANLTFDGSTLAVTGAVTVSTDLTVSGGDIVYGNGQNATASVTATAHDAAGRNLTITAGPTTAGTSNNQAGGALTLQGGQGKGSGAGGDIIFQTANASGSGSSLNSHATALTLSDDLSATFAGAIGNGTISISGGAITGVASILEADVKIGEDDQTKVDFETADEIHFYAANVHQVKLVDNAFTPQADSDVDLGASGTYWKDAFIDKISTTGNIELGHATDTTIARASSGVVTIEDSGGTARKIKTAGTENIWVPAAAMTPRDNAGCAALATVAAGTNGRPDFHVLDFDNSSDEHAQFTIAMPKSWDGGNIYYYVYWIGLAATTGVTWGLQVLSLNDNEEFNQAYGTAVMVDDDSQGDVTELLISAKSGAIACSGADNDLLCFQVYRDVSAGNDDMAGDARLWGLLLEYTTDAPTDA